MFRLLITRFSAIGDVAMTVPVVHSLASQHPEMRITMLTKKGMKPFFDWMPANVEVIGVDVNKYDGVVGLEKLFNELKKRKFDAMADLHDVLRTKYLRSRFKLSGVKTAKIDKGREDKKELMGKGMSNEALIPMTERYVQVLNKLGIEVTLNFDRAFDPRDEDYAPVFNRVGRKRAGEVWIGVAPFAAHVNKIYPLEKMHEVVRTLANHDVHVFLFGAGEEEKSVLTSWEGPNVISVCDKLGGLHNEMLLMSKLDTMLAMDSANMHIAALVGTRVFSIWGATHPKAGFTPWHQPLDNIIQMENLPCRPCSVYGDKPCQFGDLRCMNLITPEMILEKLLMK